MNNQTKTTEIDEEYVKDLYLSAVNDGDIYERCGKPCVKNLQKKVKKGIFDENKAAKIFELSFLELARDHYEKSTGVKPRMNKAEKEMFGRLVYGFYKEEVEA